MHKLTFLGRSQLFVYDFLINCNEWLLPHYAGGDGRPLGVSLADAFLGNHRNVKLLVPTEQYD